jgi:hypothetical protein
MINRRNVLGGSTLGGLLAAISAVPDAEASAEPVAAQEAASLRELGGAIRDLRDILREEIRRQYSFWELNPVRDATRPFLRANGKYPDFLEVGTDIWQQVYDWHVRFQQPLSASRTADGRYALVVMGTTLIMRVDVQPNYVGIPYDNR